MKRLIIILSILSFAIKSIAQIKDDIGKITIQAYIPSYEEIPDEAEKLLKTKLSQIITLNGIADNELSNRFVLTAKVNILSKDIVASTPQRISQKMELTFMIGDIQEGKIYSSFTMPLIGIGTNLTKSYISAFKNINVHKPEISKFIEDSKPKIVSFYQNNCESMIKEAENFRQVGQYDKAIYQLSSIPNVCNECYEKSSALAIQIYKEKIQVQDKSLLQKAKNEWAKSPNEQGANQAFSYIDKISSMSSLQLQVDELTNEIAKKLKDDEKRRWKFKLEQYRDNIEREKREWNQKVQEYNDRQKKESEDRAFARQKYADDVVTQRMLLQACRDVSLEYARNQPKSINNYNKIYVW